MVSLFFYNKNIPNFVSVEPNITLMKLFYHYLFIAICSIGLFSACTVQKRHFRNGYTVHLKKDRTSNEDFVNKERETFPIEPKSFQIKSLDESATLIQESTKDSKELPAIKNKIQLNNSVLEKVNHRKNKRVIAPELNKCDTIRKLNGEFIVASVLSESSREIIYQLCGKENGSKYFLKMSEIESISYYDGRVKSFAEPNYTESTEDTERSVNSGGEDRSQILAFILALIAGAIGVHRFYLGYYVLGVLYILTFGFCLIGVIVDLILILAGELQPKNGEYTDQIF